jgi:hypothetical protein
MSNVIYVDFKNKIRESLKIVTVSLDVHLPGVVHVVNPLCVETPTTRLDEEE